MQIDVHITCLTTADPVVNHRIFNHTHLTVDGLTFSIRYRVRRSVHG